MRGDNGARVRAARSAPYAGRSGENLDPRLVLEKEFQSLNRRLDRLRQHALELAVCYREPATQSRHPTARPFIFDRQDRQPDKQEKNAGKHGQEKTGGSEY